MLNSVSTVQRLVEVSGSHDTEAAEQRFHFYQSLINVSVLVFFQPRVLTLMNRHFYFTFLYEKGLQPPPVKVMISESRN